MNCWKLTVLGASSTITPPGDSTACLHLDNGKQSILIDAGGNLPALMGEANIDYRKITDLIITHSHPDHCYGLPFLSHAFYHGHRRINGYSSAEAIPRLKKSLRAFDLETKNRYLDIDFKEINTRQKDTIPAGDKLQIETLPTRHSRPGFGLKMTGTEQTIVFSSDSAPGEEIIDAAQKADILIHDCQGLAAYQRYFAGSHTNSRKLGEIARECKVKCLVPFHYNTTELPQSFHELVAEIRTVYKGLVIKPAKGLSFFL
ncbi:MAG: MBL fold metallo-hydrolase [bacterium]